MSKTRKTDDAAEYRWDLSCFYAGLDDPQIDADCRALALGAADFCADHKGKLDRTLGQAIRDLTELDMLSNKVFVYLNLRTSLKVDDPAVKAKTAAAEKIVNEAFGQYMAFFDNEVAGLPEAAIAAQAVSDPVVAKHLPWIRDLRRFAPHLLADDVEAALIKRSSFGPGTWADFFGEVEAGLRFPFRRRWYGRRRSLTLTKMLDVLSHDRDPAVRARTLRLINDGFKGAFAKYSAQTLYMIVGSKEVEDRERKYGHPMAARNLGNKVPDAVVEALHAAIAAEAPAIVGRYYRLKARLLGMKRLRWSDRNAELPFSAERRVSFAEAMETVLAAYASFSPTLAGLVKDMAARRWIDAPADEGKESGAYNCSLVLPGNRPVAFTLLNYLGAPDDVMTLAHELGHGVHGLLGGEAQGPLMYHAPTAYCETASVFGELTTFNNLKADLASRGSVKETLALVMSKIDDVLNTTVRQISFSNFERRVHGSGRRLSVEELCGIWLEETRKLYGEDGDVFTYENTDHLWAYISHFHRPFYVYSYAFGELLTHSLYARRAMLGDSFEPLYLDLLRSGGTRDAVDLLKPFGLDPTAPDFWRLGIKLSLGVMLEEAESLARLAGYGT